MGILGSLFGGVYYATSGPKKPAAAATPPINASSSDEADFIKCVISSGRPPKTQWLTMVTGSSWRSRRRSSKRGTVVKASGMLFHANRVHNALYRLTL